MKRSKQTKKALTSSVLALVLCFVMLLGTTFAWFTDTASTKVNTIQAGNLKVDLGKMVEDKWVSLKGETLSWQKAEGHENEAVLWEPGATYDLEPVTIKNAGNLALKYKVVISGINGSEKLNEAIEWTISEGTNKVAGSNGEYYLTAGTTDTLTISGTMKTTAGNEYQGLSIDSIAIAVEATQYTYEYDSTTNQYDKNATYGDPWDGESSTPATKAADGKYHITSAAEFIDFINNYMTYAVADARQYVLDCDIDLGGHTIKTTAAQGDRLLDGTTFDGQNHTVSNFTIDSTANPNGYYGGLFGYMAGYNASTIKNLIVRNATVIGGKQTGVIIGGMNGANSTVENCKVYDCTVIGTKKVGSVVGYTASGIVKDCYAENCTVYCAENDANECDQVVGYINKTDAGCVDNTSNNESKNVTVNYGVTAVSSAAELANAINNSAATVVLTSDITLTNPLAISGKTLTIEGGNHKLTGKVISISNSANVTIKDLKITGITSTNAILTVASNSKVELSGNTEICNNTSTSNIVAVTTGGQLTANENVKINNNTTSLHVLFVSRKTNATAACYATLNNVEIKGNKANGSEEKFTRWEGSAGLIAVSDESYLTINGGNIEDNTVKYCTAGVLTTRLGTIALNGVTIKNNTGENSGTDCTCNKTTCISSHEVGLYNNVGQITISADCVLEGTNHGSGMGGYVAGQAYNNRDYWPSHGSEGGATRPAY